MKCSNCHNNIKEKMSYCPYCGCDITNEIKKNKKKKKIIILKKKKKSLLEKNSQPHARFFFFDTLYMAKIKIRYVAFRSDYMLL